MRVALNGFGRIGKSFLRVLLSNNDALDLVAINVGPAESDTIAYSVQYDSLLGTYTGTVVYQNGVLKINGKEIVILNQPDPSQLPWKELAIDWVVEASGAFTHASDTQKHCKAGAKRVLITSPAYGADVTIVPGVNEKLYDPVNHKIISLGSCTTNALLPLLKVLDDAYGIEYACMTTTHAYTNSQKLLDVNPSRKDVRRSRAAAINIVPTTTGAMNVVGLIIPGLEGKVSGCAIRVPVPIVSLLDLTFIARKKFDKESLNALFRDQVNTTMKGIIEVSDAYLVSSDFAGNSHSVIVDADLTHTSGPLGKLYGWYDNEWGYSMRLRDFLMYSENK